MDKMLALLPNSEQPGILFKSVFLGRLPGDMRDHVQAHAEELDCRNFATLADNIWRARIARKPNTVATLSTMQDEEDEETAVGTINIKKGAQQHRPQQPKKPRNRKAEEGKKTLKFKGLKVTPGWEERAREGREEERWKRNVEEVTEEGKGRRREKEEEE